LYVADLGGELIDLANKIERVTGQHSRMCYPDTMAGTIPANAYTRDDAIEVTTGTIPANAYTRDDAIEVTTLAEQVIKVVKNTFIPT